MSGPIDTHAFADDLSYRFQVDALNVHGRLVRLGPSIDHILTRHRYPAPVSALLGELVAATVALGETLKYNGRFVAEVNAEGAVRLLVVDYTTGGAVRGYAGFDADRIAALGDAPARIGGGRLTFTVDQGPDTERYQGIVALAGVGLAESLGQYFAQSQQLRASLALAACPAGPHWRAGCLLLEQFPDADPARSASQWREALNRLGALEPERLTDADVNPALLLDTLFGAGEVAIYKPAAVRFECRCSRARAEAILAAIPDDERADLIVDGQINVTCEFCNARYDFDPSLAN